MTTPIPAPAIPPALIPAVIGYDAPVFTPGSGAAEPGTVGIELRIYDRANPTTMLDVVPGRLDPTYLEELRGPGGGGFRILKSDPKLVETPGLLAKRNIVRVYIDGRLQGAWRIRRTEEVLVGEGEEAARAYQVSGPGLRSLLGDAVVYPLGQLGRATKDDRLFSFASPRGNWYDPTEWAPVTAMNRWDAGRLLGRVIVADAVNPGILADAPATAPDGKAKRTNGWVMPGYHLYGTTASPSAWWWDGGGFHAVVANISNAPLTHPETGAKRYPELVGPGYAAYVMVDPDTDTWGMSDDATKLELASHTYWNGQFRSTVEIRDAEGGVVSTGTMNVAEPAPPGHTDNNPWLYSPPADNGWPSAKAAHARWIWDRETRATLGGAAPEGDVYFRREFVVPTKGRYQLTVTADNAFVAYINGGAVAESSVATAWANAYSVELDLDPGVHVCAIKARNWAQGSAGVLASLRSFGDPAAPTAAQHVWVTDDEADEDGYRWTCVGYPAQPPGWTPGEVLLTLLAEAQARGVLALRDIVPTFDGDVDSVGVPWDTTVDWSFSLGTKYDEVVTRIEELKADFAIQPLDNGVMLFHAWTRRGMDRSLQVEVISDSFARTVSNAWGSPDYGTAWTIAGGVNSDYSVSGGTGKVTLTTTGTVRYAYQAVEKADVDLMVDIATDQLATGTQPLQPGVSVRMNAARNEMYVARLALNITGTVSLQVNRVLAGVETQLAAVATALASYATGTFYRLRFQVVGARLRAKVWRVGDPEPTAWMVETYDDSVMAVGTAGVRVSRPAGNTNTNPVLSYDNLMISTTIDDFVRRQPVALRPGHNVTSTGEVDEAEIVNALLTASDEGWAELEASASEAVYGRVEGYLAVSGGEGMAAQVGVATLEKLGLSQDSTTVSFEPVPEHWPWIDWFVGDTVLAPTSGTVQPPLPLTGRRVLSISVSEDPETARVEYSSEFGTVNQDRTERLERWLKSASDGTLNGSVANASGGGSGAGGQMATAPSNSGQVVPKVVVNPVLIGQVISGANIVPGSIVASDKLVANSITAQSALLADLSVVDAKIDSMTANKITAGTIMAELALAGRIATSLEGSRAEMNGTGFHLFNTDGVEVFTADTFGDVQLTGMVRSGLPPGPRVEISTEPFDDVFLGVSYPQEYPRMLMYSGAEFEKTPAYFANLAYTKLNTDGTGYDYFLRTYWLSPKNNIRGFDQDCLMTMEMTQSYGGYRTFVFDSSIPRTQFDLYTNLNLVVRSDNTLDAGELAPIYIGGGSTPGTFRIDKQVMQSYSGSAAFDLLRLQPFSGGVRINDSYLYAITPSSVNVPLQIGSNSGANMKISNTEIIACNGTNDVTLYLNWGWHDVALGGPTSTVFVGNDLAVDGNSDFDGDVLVNGNFQVDGVAAFGNMRAGQTTVPCTANTVSSATITGLGLVSGTYISLVTADTTVPGSEVVEVSATGQSASQVTLRVYRTTGTDTGVMWLMVANNV